MSVFFTPQHTANFDRFERQVENSGKISLCFNELKLKIICTVDWVLQPCAGTFSWHSELEHGEPLSVFNLAFAAARDMNLVFTELTGELPPSRRFFGLAKFDFDSLSIRPPIHNLSGVKLYFDLIPKMKLECVPWCEVAIGRYLA